MDRRHRSSANSSDRRRRSSAKSSDHEAEGPDPRRSSVSSPFNNHFPEFHQPYGEDHLKQDDYRAPNPPGYHLEEWGGFNGPYSIPDCGQQSNNPSSIMNQINQERASFNASYVHSVPSFDCGQLVHNPPVDSGEPFTPSGKQPYLPYEVTGGMHNVDTPHISVVSNEMWFAAIAKSAIPLCVGSGDDNMHEYYGHEDKHEDEYPKVKPYFEDYDRASERPKVSTVGVDDFSDSDASYEKSSVLSLTRMLLPKPKPKNVEITSGARYILYADGFYRKGKGRKCSAKGGYGVLLKRVGGESVLAKAGCSLEAVSAIYHTIEGIKNGLDLVSRYPKISKLFIVSNSHSVNEIINACFQSHTEGKCVLHDQQKDMQKDEYFKLFCEGCLENYVQKDEHFHLILGFLRKIVSSGKNLYREGTSIASYVNRNVNRPADFLAKMQLTREFEPHHFPQKLNRLIAEAGEYLYSSYT